MPIFPLFWGILPRFWPHFSVDTYVSLSLLRQQWGTRLAHHVRHCSPPPNASRSRPHTPHAQGWCLSPAAELSKIDGARSRRAAPLFQYDTKSGDRLINASNRRFRKRRMAGQPGDPAETAVDGPADLAGEPAALLTALRQLPARQRAVIVLRYWEDLTDAQIAAALGCSPGTVRSQLPRALAALRVTLGEGDGR